MFTLGINYPWVTCGHDFGPRPIPWQGAGPTDWGEVERDLKRLRALGLRVARWWIIGGGVNLPVGESPAGRAAPWLPPKTSFRKAALAYLGSAVMDRRLPQRLVDVGAPPTWPQRSLDDFGRLLTACANADVQLLPSFTSFELFFPLSHKPGGVTSRGRSAYVFDGWRQTERFCDALLEPLLDVAEQHRDALYAFEVINEPDWAVQVRGQPHLPWIEPEAMGAFLATGVGRIARRGLLSSIGFVDGLAPWLPKETSLVLRGLADDGSYLHQVHYYPWGPRPKPLPAADELPYPRAIVGEMATTTTGRWPKSAWLAEDDPERFLVARLLHVQKLGYEGALLWSVTGRDKHSDWSEGVQGQVGRFVGRG